MLDTRTADLTGGRHPIRELALAEGRVVRYLDTGEAGRHCVVFFGGIGTSAGAFDLTEFAGAERDRLGLRFISVERNGFGGTSFTPRLGFDDAVEDVLTVLAELEVPRFSVLAISGGGPYAARLVARVPERIVSLHLIAATSGRELALSRAATEMLGDVEGIVRDPGAFWRFPPGSSVHAIPGFAEAARAEGRRALADPARAGRALRHEIGLILSEELPTLHGLTAPVYLYWGADDDVVPVAQAEPWRAAVTNLAATRVYPDEGHDVQYRHWPEILRDIAEVSG